MGAWTITCDDVVIRALPTHQSPMVELDVVRRRLTLGSGAANAGDSALQTGALVRRFLEAQDVDWTDALTWAQAADDLFQRIEAGTTQDMLWSGDIVVVWSEDALAAARALFEALGQRVRRLSD